MSNYLVEGGRDGILYGSESKLVVQVGGDVVFVVLENFFSEHFIRMGLSAFGR